jgi:AcrR family transcriptional regulator
MIAMSSASPLSIGCEIPGLSPARQQRSALAQRRILEALDELLKAGDYFEIKVSDIAARAGCALGGVYNRFESKDHILLALAEQVLCERIDPRYERQENPDWHVDLSVAAFLEIYFAILARPLAEFRHIFRPLAIISRNRSNDAFARFLEAREEKAQAHLARVMLPLARAENPGASAEAARLAAYWARTLFHDYILFGEKAGAMTGIVDDRYLSELARLVAQYLAFPGPPVGSKKRKAI